MSINTNALTKKVSKRMYAANRQITDYNAELEILAVTKRTLVEFETNTEAGKAARQKAINDVITRQVFVNSELEKLEVELELATVAFLSGEDKELQGPVMRETA